MKSTSSSMELMPSISVKIMLLILVKFRITMALKKDPTAAPIEISALKTIKINDILH